MEESVSFCDGEPLGLEQNVTFEKAMTVCGPWERYPRIAVAFSGGADSLALLKLAHAWCQSLQGRVYALHVNHGMRAEAHREAQTVLDWCAQKMIDCHVLGPPTVGLVGQNQARTFRYKVLEEWCAKHAIYHLLTAHHADDQRETVAMRCVHDSGVEGLCGMRPIRATRWGRIVRPLLQQPKKFWVGRALVNDHSNTHRQYERVRVRQFFSVRQDISELCATLSKQAKAQQMGIEYHAAQFCLRYVTVDAKGRCRIKVEGWKELDLAIRLYILQRVMMVVAGRIYPVRRHVVEALERRLLDARCSTAGGCTFHRKKAEVLCMREWKRIQPCTVFAQTKAIFDGRFSVYNPTSCDVVLYAGGQKGFEGDDSLLSMPVFAEKRSFRVISLVPYKRLLYGWFRPNTPLIGIRL